MMMCVFFDCLLTDTYNGRDRYIRERHFLWWSTSSLAERRHALHSMSFFKLPKLIKLTTEIAVKLVSKCLSAMEGLAY
jgi:hypothetical protein